MRQKRTLDILCSIFIVILAVSVIYIVAHNMIIKNHDVKLWNEFRTNLNSDDISTVGFFGTKSVSFQDKEKNEFIDIFKKSTFYKSNRELVGSTGVAIILHYTNDSEFSINCQGRNLFELRYKDLQFFIKNAELTNLMDKHGIKWYDT